MTEPLTPEPRGKLDRRRLLALGVLGGAAAGTAGLLTRGQGSAAVSPVAQSTAEAVTPVNTLRPLRIYGDDGYPAWFRQAMPLDAPRSRYPSFPAGRTVLKKGTVRRAGAAALPCDIVLDRDAAVRLRDGTTIYANVFRPTGAGAHPTIVAWGAYGKEVGGQWLDDEVDRLGVPLSAVSELQRFEGPDPAYWVDKGYAVCNPDPRGVGRSEGDIVYWGRQLAEDGYDFIEWVAGQPWSNGKVGMSGNSYLAVSQWFIAAERPPHLAAIAPWEGFSDHFREAGNRGGIPVPMPSDSMLATISGSRLIEDQPLMMVKEQLLTPYWKDKQARLERITVPAYVVASWTNAIHTRGSLAGFRGISSRDKWLRVHNSQEWRDYYDPTRVEDLRRFFDHYLKGEQNGWRSTPVVRLSVLDPGGTDTVDRVEREFPLARTRYQDLHLTSAGELTETPQRAADTVRYPVGAAAGVPDSPPAAGQASFTMVMKEDTELIGYLSLRLWVEAQGADDMELSVTVKKLDAAGKPLTGPESRTSVVATGALRVSHRRLDRGRSTAFEPVLAHTVEERLSPGQIVPVDIDIWPMGLRLHKGEQLSLTVAENMAIPFAVDLGYGVAALTLPAGGGTYAPGDTGPTVTLGGTRNLPEFVTRQQVTPTRSRNAGTHILHVGGRYDSYLRVPVVPRR